MSRARSGLRCRRRSACGLIRRKPASAWRCSRADGTVSAMRGAGRLNSPNVLIACRWPVICAASRWKHCCRALLADFDLRRESKGADSYLIHAELKAGHTNCVLPRGAAGSGFAERRAAQTRGASSAQRPAGGGRSRSRSSKRGEQPDASYTLAGHLAPDAVIYDRGSGPLRRGPLLMEFLAVLWGETAAN